MSLLVRKEARMLLPAWATAVAAAASIRFTRPFLEPIWTLCCAAAVLILALSSFGKETSYGTFGLMLVQPEERLRWWRAKVSVLLLALLSVWAVFVLCLPERVDSNDRLDFIGYSALGVLLVFSGGLWTTLLLRDMVSALFCTFLAPLMIWGAVVIATSHWATPENNLIEITSWTALILYAGIGYWWARRLFLRAEDLGWTGGQISLRPGHGVLRGFAFECRRGQGRWTALVLKELQLQQVTMVLIPILALMHVAAVVVCHMQPAWVGRNSDILFDAVPYLWMGAIPVVIGCASVAEERRLNTLEGLLCLPVSKRASFSIKLAVSLVLGVLLGGCIPWLLLHIGNPKPPEWSFAGFIALAAAGTLAAFYASTMSRGFLQAIPALLGVGLFLGAGFNLFVTQFLANQQWNGEIVMSSVFPALAVPVAVVTFTWLALRNYRQLRTGWAMWRENLLRVGAACIGVAVVSTAIFDRDWEWFMQMELPHGTTRISGSGHSSIGTWGPLQWLSGGKIAIGRGPFRGPLTVISGIYALLPDGRLWLGQEERSILAGDLRDVVTDVSGKFLARSNWVQVATSQRSGTVGLQSDGTLWRIDAERLIEIGSDSDWKEFGAAAVGFMALKKNGTLWGWGGIQALLGQPGRFSGPSRRQIGTNSDWVHVFVMRDGGAVGVKRDGTTWKWGQPNYGFGAASQLRKDGGVELYQWDLTGTNWASILTVWNITLGIRADGSLWASGYLPKEILGTSLEPGWHRRAVRVGDKSDWVSLSGGGAQVTALKADGTLWTSQFNSSNTKRPSRYTDWIAHGQDSSHTWGLARDGTLTCWDPFHVTFPRSQRFWQRFFLGPTRRPLYSYNILDLK